MVSAGELLKALKAGIKANKIVFSGVGKSEDELRIAINKRILLINCESESEAKLIDKIARKLRKNATIPLPCQLWRNAQRDKTHLQEPTLLQRSDQKVDSMIE